MFRASGRRGGLLLVGRRLRLRSGPLSLLLGGVVAYVMGYKIFVIGTVAFGFGWGWWCEVYSMGEGQLGWVRWKEMVVLVLAVDE